MSTFESLSEPEKRLHDEAIRMQYELGVMTTRVSELIIDLDPNNAETRLRTELLMRTSNFLIQAEATLNRLDQNIDPTV